MIEIKMFKCQYCSCLFDDKIQADIHENICKINLNIIKTQKQVIVYKNDFYISNINSSYINANKTTDNYYLYDNNIFKLNEVITIPNDANNIIDFYLFYKKDQDVDPNVIINNEIKNYFQNKINKFQDIINNYNNIINNLN